MDLWVTLLRLDPSSPVVPALCALMALALAAVIVGGFAVLRHVERVERAPRERTAWAAPRELDLLALWRLGRPRRGGSTILAPAAGATGGDGSLARAAPGPISPVNGEYL